MVEDIAGFFGGFILGIEFFGRMMMECRMVDKVVVAIMVVNKMVWYFGRVDFG